MIQMVNLFFCVLFFAGFNSSIGVFQITKTNFVNNRIEVEWSGNSTSYDVRIKCNGITRLNERVSNTVSYTVQNALDCQSYRITVYELSTGNNDVTSFQTPSVVRAMVGSSINLAWSSTSVNQLGYNIKNMDNNRIFIQLAENRANILDNDTDFLGDPANIDNCTKIRIKNVHLRHGGYIVSASGTSVVGGVILAVQGQPSKPQITPVKLDVAQDRTITLTCRSNANTKPDYVKFPAITYNWFVNGSDQKPSRYRASGSDLTITSVTRNDAFNRISCRATQNNTDSVKSDEVNINVQYGPEAATLTPNTNTYNKNESQNFGPISCSAECNPVCKIQWRFNASVGNGNFQDINTSSYGSLSIVNVTRNMTGVYRCFANNTVGSNRSDVFLNVLFPPDKPTVRIGNEIVNDKTVLRNESSYLTIQCSTSSNPTSSLTVRNQSEGLDTKESNSISYRLDSVRCEDSGNYSCRAGNTIGTSELSFNLQIQCKPRLQKDFKGQFGAEINSTLQIRIPVIANPKPSIKWTENNNAQTIVHNVTRNGLLYQYLITANLTIMSTDQFGNFTFTVSNGIGANSYTINITPKGKPLPVEDFSFNSLESHSVNLTWTTGFNGGSQQHFIIAHGSPKKSEWIVVKNVTDPGQTKLMSYLVQGLIPNRRYKFRIVSGNAFGDTSKMPVFLEVTTKGFSMSGSKVGVAAGVSAMVVVIIIAIVIFFAIRNLRKKQGERGGKMKYKHTSRNEDGFVPPRNVNDDENMYANSSHDNTLQIRYAAPSEPNTGPTRTQNQDGLIYIDVDFQKPNQSPLGKPVIHGDDSRTNYMQVDFTNNISTEPTDSETAD